MPTAIDLFCGAGGLSLGFELAGFEVVAAVDNDPIAGDTYRRQNPHVPLFTQDVKSITGKSLLLTARQKYVDLIIGGPSCQGFSTHGKRDPNDPRNFLFRHFARIVEEIGPSWVVMENVKGLLTYDRGRYRDQIYEIFERIGYRISSRVLRAVEYGVPQLRERLFFIATNTNEDITFPNPTHCSPEMAALTGLTPYVTVRDAIGDLETIGEEGSSIKYATLPLTPFQRFARRNAPRELTLHRARRVSDYAMDLISKIPPGEGIRAISEERLPARFRKMRKISTGALRRDCTTLYHRLSWDKPAYTITCYFTNVSSGPFVHPSEDRALTPREAARLQSFPDSYQFLNRGIQRQIGNAVPPILAKTVAEEIANKISRAIISLPYKHTAALAL